ncbi:MAG TPA: YdcF family protein [Ardenticatenaceae bacterium]|nr:YdcF family protein [Ardenticatenaceae bacterium]
MRTIGRLLWNLLALLGLASLLYVALMVVLVYRQAARDEAAAADAIVVLGTAQWNGRPSPVLRARLDHALSLYQDGLAPLMVTTGGYGRDRRFSEAGVGRDYLLARGVPPEAILTEEVGSSSWESLVAASELLEPLGARRVLLVSDPFHMRRLKLMSAQLGLQPMASPTRTSPISRRPSLEFSYVLREVVSLTYHGLGLQATNPASALLLLLHPGFLPIISPRSNDGILARGVRRATSRRARYATRCR